MAEFTSFLVDKSNTVPVHAFRPRTPAEIAPVRNVPVALDASRASNP